jgi:hypothetical protein
VADLADSNTCSGIRQAPWAVDHVLVHFTRLFRWWHCGGPLLSGMCARSVA